MPNSTPQFGVWSMTSCSVTGIGNLVRVGGMCDQERLFLSILYTLHYPIYYSYTQTTMFPSAIRSASRTVARPAANQAHSAFVRSTPLSLARGNLGLNVGKRFNTQESRGGKSKLVSPSKYSTEARLMADLPIRSSRSVKQSEWGSLLM